MKKLLIKLIPLQLKVLKEDYKKYHLIKGQVRNSILGKPFRGVVYMADGKVLHGGLSDRLCGIISLYQYCKLHGKDFKIFFEHPYSLNQYLQPNMVNWQIEAKDLSSDDNVSKIVSVSLFSHHVWLARLYANLLLNSNKLQTLAYSNMRYFYRWEFSGLFNELFKPSEIVDNEVKKNKEGIGTEEYVSLTFRFQQLLGDFKEGNFDVLSEDKREVLIEKCLDCLRWLWQIEGMKILVTSDSQLFLTRAKKEDYVYVIPGEFYHIDYAASCNMRGTKTELKSYVDFYMLANAQRIYLADFQPLYRTSFPMTAALLKNKPLIEISCDKNGSFHSKRTDRY